MKKDIKSYIIDGKKMEFDSSSFKVFFNSAKEKKGVSVVDYETELGVALSVSSSAIHNWRFGMNGPSDTETIKKLADYMELSDYKFLLKEKQGKKVMQISERQKDSLKRIYDAVIDYLDEFLQSDGFNDYWHKLCVSGFDPKNVEQLLYDKAENEQHKVEIVLKKEYIELYKLPVYNLLEEFVYDGLTETYNGKLSYAYRFEAPVELADGTPSGVTTEEDYANALKRINDLLEDYM